jgi:cell wall assembly regulator SMI1
MAPVTSVNNDIEAIWKQIEAWYAANAPQQLAQLRPPSTDQEIASLETLIGLPIPADYRASLMRHDGGGFMYGSSYLNVGWVKQVWQRMNTWSEDGRFAEFEPADSSGMKFQPVWWSAKWLPVAEHRARTITCLDLAPGPEGMVGQVLQSEPQDDGPRATRWNSFSEFLDQYRSDLQSGKYYVDETGELNLQA